MNKERKSTESDITRFRTINGYISNVLNITDNLLVMASLRVDSYKNDDMVVNGVEISTKTDILKIKFPVTARPSFHQSSDWCMKL